MTSKFKSLKFKLLVLIVILNVIFASSQNDNSLWKLQVALGINNPIDNGENDGYYSKYINLPTVNLGIQHMFSNTFGAKLDFGFNRSKNADSSLEFKLNYTRLNAQLVYNMSPLLSFLPQRLQIISHAGPGVSITQPLGNFVNNKYTFLNVLAGAELHYGLSRELSIYGDLSYVLSLSNKEKYNLNVDGFSFNGDLIYVTFGVSISLSGCYYC